MKTRFSVGMVVALCAILSGCGGAGEETPDSSSDQPLSDDSTSSVQDQADDSDSVGDVGSSDGDNSAGGEPQPDENSDSSTDDTTDNQSANDDGSVDEDESSDQSNDSTGSDDNSEDEVVEADIDAAAFYSENIESPLVQARCVACHVENGLSGNTDLVFIACDAQATVNQSVVEAYVDQTQSRATLLLNKVRGAENHGGGAVFPSSSQAYQDLVTFLALLTDSNPASDEAATGGFFADLTMAGTEQTLRRAALIMNGRLPTDEEVSAALESETALRETLRGMMTGEGFHEFLLRGANDRLLTDAFLSGRNFDIADGNSPYYANLANLQYTEFSNNNQSDYYAFRSRFAFGLARAPLELIAYVVENDRPYTEILTADYTLLNPFTNTIFNGGLTFTDNEDPNEFRVGRNAGQIVTDDQYSAEFEQGLGVRIDSQGSFIDYPHAGLLNEPAFLNRFPTTETNRNRARARWTFYHFLDLDIEKSAARTTDPDALADTDNPTLNNPNCTVCHEVMDPVAGAFQNYNDEGWYRASWGGLDSLPNSYKWESGSPYETGDTWFRDMRVPGFNGTDANDNSATLQWLGQSITSDDRFAKASVKFWWPALMSAEILEIPENSDAADFEAKLTAFEAQNAFIESLAEGFRTGFNGGQSYDLKDLLVELIMSDWFRATATTEPLDEGRTVQLEGVGTDRLLTPEELEAKTRALIGFAWGERDDATWTIDNMYSNLQDRFPIYYGGIDSDGITDRARELNALMSNVALAQALSVSCPTVLLDMNREPGSRLLFDAVDRNVTPLTEFRELEIVTGDSDTSRSTHNASGLLSVGERRISLTFNNPYYDAEAGASSLLVLHQVTIYNSQNQVVASYVGSDFESVDGFSQSTNQNGDPTGLRYYDNAVGAFTGWFMWSGSVELPLTVTAEDTYRISVDAGWRNLPERSVELSIAVNSTDPNSGSQGELQLRQQLQSLHSRLLGQTLAVDSAEMDENYNLLVSLWQTRQADNVPQSAVDWSNETCEIPIDGYWDQDRTADFFDPFYMQGTWASMMIYLLTDYHYLHE